MTDIFINFFRVIGVDRAISYGILARFWGIIAGPITLLIIALRFSREQQGFYFTFRSLLAMQVFFELGLMFVIAQFASHEFAYLTWETDGRIKGGSQSLSRFTDLLCKSVKWYALASILLLILLIPAGLIFFGNEGDTAIHFSWRIPWVLAVLGTSINLLTIPFFGVIMGSGDVVTVNHREMIGAILGSCISWMVIGLNGGLFAVFSVTIGNILVAWIYLIKSKPQLLKLAWEGIFVRRQQKTRGPGISWWNEVWPMQWKIALSWVSGYFIFQLFNPVLFYYHGPVIAGQMGMTLIASNSLLAVCMTWMNTKSPEFGKLIALRNWKSLDQLFFLTLKQSIVMALLGSLTGFSIILFLQSNFSLGQRFIPATQVAFLLGAVCIQTINSSFAIYLRSHKKEPFMWLSIIVGIIQGLTTWFLGMRYGSFGVTVGFFLVVCFITFPAAWFIWKKCRHNWHHVEMGQLSVHIE